MPLSPSTADAILLGIWHADGRAACTGALRDWQGETVPDVLAITGQPWTVLVQALMAAECIDAGSVLILSNDAALVRALSPPFLAIQQPDRAWVDMAPFPWLPADPVMAPVGGDPQQWQALCLLGGRWGGRFRAMLVDDLPKARGLWQQC